MEAAITAAPREGLRDSEAAARPFSAQQPPAPRPGDGRIAVAMSDGASAVVACAAASPLQLLLPRPRGALAWIVSASHGGGLVAGDAVSLAVEVGPGARALLSTQASTKVYRSPGPETSQRLHARVAADAVLAVLPHPVSPFEGARYTQTQRLEVEAGGSVAWLDAVTAGRVARAERWGARSYRSRTEVVAAGRTIAADALRLVAEEGAPVGERLEGVAILATAIVLGPAFAEGAAALLEALAATPATPVARDAPLLAAASPLADGLLLRVAADAVEPALLYLRERLAFVTRAIGADPFARSP